MKSHPRILYITSHWPGAHSYGAQQRSLNVGRLLQRVGRVTVVIASSDRPTPETLDRTRSEFEVARAVYPQIARRSLVGRIRHELDPTYLNTDACLVSAEDRIAIQRLVAEHDVTWIQTVRVANRFGIWRWPASVLDVDDIPSQLYRTANTHEASVSRRFLNRRMQWIWNRRERRFPSRFAVVAVCSEADRRYFPRASVEVIPNGFTVIPLLEGSNVASQNLGFIGNFRWGPNADGIAWFLSEVWPLVKTRTAGTRVRLIGDGSERYASADVDALGWVSEPAAEIASWAAMIVPIRMGGGTRMKMAEAFARHCPVVSTTLGAYGYAIQSGQDALVADDPIGFANACIQLIEDPGAGKRMAARAHGLFLRQWTWNSFVPRVERAVEAALKHSRDISPSTPAGMDVTPRGVVPN